MIIYISGKITGDEKARERFAEAEELLKKQGHQPINPFKVSDACPGLKYEQYMSVDFALIAAAEAVYLLSNWKSSPGALREYEYATIFDKKIIEEE